MELVDLHVHSNASDGTCTPSEVVHLALQKGLSAIALTDHDTIDGIPEALQTASSTTLEVIPGAELSCVYRNCDIHILGLFLDCHNPALNQALTELRSIRDRRNQDILSRLNADGIAINWDHLYQGNPHTVITRAHFARALTTLGYTKTIDTAFKKYLQYGGKYCMPKKEPTPRTIMQILNANHAFPILAHPLQYKLDRPVLLQLISDLKAMGLMGLECYHSSNNPYESRILREFARNYQLLPTGGSDFHGNNKPDIEIGTGRGGLRISSALLEDIKKAHTACF